MGEFSIEKLDTILKGELIASCQPVVDGPLDTDDIVVALAQACLAGGAAGVRIEGVERVAKVRQKIDAPIIGIVKRDSDEYDVRITPIIQDVVDLAKAGADIIAVDATDRPRPEALKNLVDEIHKQNCFVMADCSTVAEAKQAVQLGCTFVGTTLSGYTGGPVPDAPDFEFLKEVVNLPTRAIAEGRFNTPELAAEARALGAWGITVGSALTRIENITSWFTKAIKDAEPEPAKKLKANI